MELLKQYGEPILVAVATISIVVLMFTGWNAFDASKPSSVLTEIGDKARILAKKDKVEKPNTNLFDQTKQTFGVCLAKDRTLQGEPTKLDDLIVVESNEQHFDSTGNATDLFKFTWNETNKRFERTSSGGTIYVQKGIVNIESVKDTAGVDITSSVMKLTAGGIRAFTFTDNGTYTIRVKVTTEDKTIVILDLNMAIDLKNN